MGGGEDNSMLSSTVLMNAEIKTQYISCHLIVIQQVHGCCSTHYNIEVTRNLAFFNELSDF